ncbi:nicotinate-nucleotide adenylyltransferase [Acetobacter fallax]|uniref:Probable nicotinate-nucleotide adenylyltransferase n=1 Tax=Acetobacter fallax TaxID=1737473 RepID=A0ABX0K6Y8_9PROT|nr:nicotinate-nucleotide adenylyltransferase [Acetobacter fallax]NHO32170.1 nicotinate-nucleotide adenylyltransferase [Acetobacter fallax]NHO35777.1 nicotinate-nucleotide adenylyltransferase [Acetobacter fallax]
MSDIVTGQRLPDSARTRQEPQAPAPHSGDPLPARGDNRRLRIGLLGGSFNPAHPGHILIASRAARALSLDQVWLMVSPGNPLKPRHGMAPLTQRLASVRRLVRGRTLIPTTIETRLGTRYTVDTIRTLKTRFPNARFVWIMGADVFTQLPRWRRWKDVIRTVPIAVMPRPGSNAAALRGQAASFLRHYRLPTGKIRQLPEKTPPVWAFLPGPQNGISSTALRNAEQ